MSDEGKKITNVEIPDGLLKEEQRPKKDQNLINMLKHKYIEKGIKITDDDPLIAIILGQDVLLDVYATTLDQQLNQRLDTLERALSTFPVKVSEELNERAESYLSMIEKIDDKSQTHLNNEFSSFTKRVSDYAKDTETYLRSVNKSEDKPQQPQINGFKIFALCFVSSLISVTIALAVGYQLLVR